MNSALMRGSFFWFESLPISAIPGANSSFICVLLALWLRFALRLVRRAHQRRDVENQYDPSFSEDGCPRHARHSPVVRLERLDHHLLLPEQRIHQQRNAAAVGLEHHEDALLDSRTGKAEDAAQRHERQILAADLDDLALPRDGAHFGSAGPDALDDRGE